VAKLEERKETLPITLLLVPVLYVIFVVDLKILRWETKERQPILAKAEAAAD